MFLNLDKKSKTYIYMLGIFLIVLIGAIDYITGPEITLAYYYIFPIGLVTWYVDEIKGAIFSVVVGIIWTINDFLYITSFVNKEHFYMNITSHCCFLILIVYTLMVIKTTFECEKTYARNDPLTGVHNRRAFNELVDFEIERSKRYRHPFSLVYIDLDEFKAINDILGHEAGDVVLSAVGKIIKQNTRKADVVARLGGDEFAIFMPETNFEESEIVVNRIRENLLKIMKKNLWFITFSIGIATFVNLNANANINLEYALQKADRLMYRAKEAGKNMIKHEIITE